MADHRERARAFLSRLPREIEPGYPLSAISDQHRERVEYVAAFARDVRREALREARDEVSKLGMAQSDDTSAAGYNYACKVLRKRIRALMEKEPTDAPQSPVEAHQGTGED